jgi:hypothetical protein
MDTKHLKDAALCALKFVEIYTGDGSRTQRYKALKALAQRALDDLDAKKIESEYGCTAYDMSVIVTGRTAFDDSEKKNINRILKDLQKHLPEHSEMFKQIALEYNYSAIPSYSFEANRGSGSGIYTTHFISPIALSSDDISSPTEELKSDEIKYYLESVNNLPFLFRWINNFEIYAWRQKLLFSVLIFAIVIISCLFLLFMIIFIYSKDAGIDILRSAIGTLGIASIIAIQLRLIYLCLTNRIISAPILLLPNNVDNAQIEYVATEKLSPTTGRPIRKFRVVIYSSTCPICKSRIEVENGGREFHNRLIGRCTEVPLEHVYSFDRFLCKGKALRR